VLRQAQVISVREHNVKSWADTAAQEESKAAKARGDHSDFGSQCFAESPNTSEPFPRQEESPRVTGSALQQNVCTIKSTDLDYCDKQFGSTQTLPEHFAYNFVGIPIRAEKKFLQSSTLPFWMPKPNLLIQWARMLVAANFAQVRFVQPGQLLRPPWFTHLLRPSLMLRRFCLVIQKQKQQGSTSLLKARTHTKGFWRARMILKGFLPTRKTTSRVAPWLPLASTFQLVPYCYWLECCTITLLYLMISRSLSNSAVVKRGLFTSVSSPLKYRGDIFATRECNDCCLLGLAGQMAFRYRPLNQLDKCLAAGLR
jgi:hypothetical protein